MFLQKVLNMERIERKAYTGHILNLLDKGEVVVLTGHRRAGICSQSTVKLFQIFTIFSHASLVADNHAAYLSFILRTLKNN